jgi:hypothetical protein
MKVRQLGKKRRWFVDKRQKRKREEQRRRRKAQHVENRHAKIALHPDDVVPLGISGDVNLYDYMKDMIRSGNTHEAEFQGINIHKYIGNVDKTLDHFKIDLEKRSGTGDLLIRFGLLYSQQPDSKVFSIDPNEPHLNFLADLWEYFNKLEL